MAISVGDSAEGEALCDINTTPLIDVMLVLLIMFIITIPAQTHASKIDMPPPNPPTNDKPPPKHIIGVTFDNQITWDGNPVSFEQMEGYLHTEGQKADADQAEIHLNPDPHSVYDTTAKVVAAVQLANIKKMGFEGNAAYAN